MSGESLLISESEAKANIMKIASTMSRNCAYGSHDEGPSADTKHTLHENRRIHEQRKRCHLGFARLHLLLVTSKNANLFVPFSVLMLHGSSKLASTEDGDLHANEIRWYELSHTKKMEQHRLLRELHLQSAADIGSREAQRILGGSSLFPHVTHHLDLMPRSSPQPS